MRRFFRKFTKLKAVEQRLRQLEQKVEVLEKIADERDSLWLFIDEMRSQEIEAQRAIQEELESVIIRSFTPQGDA
jgi:replication-associated recombination protein RarA